MFCPLGRQSIADLSHVHDPCACLDRHIFDAAGICTQCGQTRCVYIRSKGERVRCTRANGHGKRHLYHNG